MANDSDTSQTAAGIDWWRFCWRALMAVSAAAAIVASYTYLRDLAIVCGWDGWRASLLPVSLDVLGIAAFALYIKKRDAYAQAVSVLVVVASAVGNALSHLYAVTGTAPASEVVLAVGSAPVVAAIVLAHLWAHERKDRTDVAIVDSDAGAGDTDSDGAAPGLDGDGRSADTNGPRDSGTRSADPSPRRRATKAATRTRSGGRGPTGPDVDTVAADIRRLGIHSKRQAKAHFGIGDDKVNQPVVVAALTANNNGH